MRKTRLSHFNLSRLSVLETSVLLPTSELLMRTRPLGDNQMSRRCHSCLKLVNDSRAFRIHEDKSSDARPPGEVQLLTKCIYFIQFV